MPNSSSEDLRQAIISMAVEAWRFRRVFHKAVSKLDSGEGRRYIGQFNWFLKKVDSALETAGLRVVDVEGKLYDIGMAVIPLNIDEFEADDILYIEQMVEPIIMDESTVLKMGTVMLGRYER